MRSRPVAALSIIALALIVLMTLPQASGGARARAAPAPAQILRIGITPGVMPEAVLDPLTSSYLVDLMLDQMMFGGVVKMDAHGIPRPDMATGYTLSADKRTYTFTLRHGMRFADGTPITAQDVVWSWTYYIQLKTSSASAYATDIVGADQVLAGKAKTVAGLSAPDAYTVKVTTTHPASYFLSMLCTSGFLIVEKANVLAGTKKSPWINHAVGSGMYTLKEYKPDVRVVLVANPYYYGPKPQITEVIGSMLGDSQTQLVAYENNEFDIMFPSTADARRFLAPGGPHHAETMAVVEPGFTGLGMNTHLPPTDDIHVRQALAMATDTDLLARAVLHDLWPPARRMMWPNPIVASLPIKGLPYDPARARKVLAMSRYGANPSKIPQILFVVPTPSAGGTPEFVKYAQALQPMWQQTLGLNVKLLLAPSSYMAAHQHPQVQIAGWGNDFTDPWEMFHMVGNGHGGLYASYWVGNPKQVWDDPTFDRLDAEAASTFDPHTRARLFAQMDEIWTDSASWIPLFYARLFAVAKPWVHGWQMPTVDTIPLVGAGTSLSAH